jgi:hypothetical protein
VLHTVKLRILHRTGSKAPRSAAGDRKKKGSGRVHNTKPVRLTPLVELAIIQPYNSEIRQTELVQSVEVKLHD